jgi:hypothetical protein
MLKEGNGKINIWKIISSILALAGLVTLAFKVNSSIDSKIVTASSTLKSNIESTSLGLKSEIGNVSSALKNDIGDVSSDIKLVEYRLDLKIENDKLDQARKELREMERDYGTDGTKAKDKKIKDQIRELKDYIPDQADKVKTIRDKTLDKDK